VVGYDFSLEVPWVDIHRDLAGCFPDISVLVPSIATFIKSYLDRITSLLDDQKFQDAFLEKMSWVSSRTIVVRVGEKLDEDTSAFDKNGRLVLSLPQTGPEWYRKMNSRAGHDLESVFLNKDGRASKVKIDVQAQSDWVDVVSAKTGSVSKITSLPSLDTLGNPETLFASMLPYYAVVTNSGPNIHVQASHQPTIDLVHGYFEKHTRKNMNFTTHVLPPS
jgi:hypothetical protein